MEKYQNAMVRALFNYKARERERERRGGGGGGREAEKEIKTGRQDSLMNKFTDG